MRGKENYENIIAEYNGITPAYAGKSKTPLNTPAITRDHPRVCGEKDT